VIEIRLRVGKQRILASPVGLILVDDFTQSAPLGKIRAKLERQDEQDPSVWIPLDVRPVVTLGGLLVFPGLNRHPFPQNGEPKRMFRVRLSAEFYRVYPPTEDGYRFEAPAFNDVHPPPNMPPRLQVILLPAAHYPFPAEVPVLRGQVVDATTKAPLKDAEVAEDNRQRALTDERGEFALPLHRAQTGVVGAVIGGVVGVVLPIDASYGGRVKTTPVHVPSQLGRNLRIEIP